MATSDQINNTNTMINNVEKLLDNLEGIEELLLSLKDKYLEEGGDSGASDDQSKVLMFQKFQDGIEAAQNVVGILKAEKWRLSRRQMSVELRMGELEDYKLHLKKDMSSLNETVDVLSLRIVQLENQLVDAQERNEALEWERNDFKKLYEDSLKKCSEYNKKMSDMASQLHKSRGPSYSQSQQPNFSVESLLKENKQLKALLAMKQEPADDTAYETRLANLTKDFLNVISNLDSPDPTTTQES
ncbi:uncharacterized protein LOC131936932 [Physella acuta]|uniref:uncharacterized protein LOC131936932 n=1 Tax=Physella acuta TaxID=109671 RepID=UPI0027DAD763|nr:uncharacterized protein LOC131936932 [Physella acuta]